MGIAQATLGEIQSPTQSTSDRIQRCFALRSQTAAQDAFVPAAVEMTNGNEDRYADKCGTYSKGIQQAAIGLVDLAAYQTFRDALDSGHPADFDAITLGGTRTLNGPQGGLAFDLEGLDSSQFSVPAAPALSSEAYATELVELYWGSLLRDIAFTTPPMLPPCRPPTNCLPCPRMLVRETRCIKSRPSCCSDVDSAAKR